MNWDLQNFSSVVALERGSMEPPEDMMRVNTHTMSSYREEDLEPYVLY